MKLPTFMPPTQAQLADEAHRKHLWALGEAIQVRRRALFITAAQIAEGLRELDPYRYDIITGEFLWEIERGSEVADETLMRDICTVLGCTLETLTDYHHAPRPALPAPANNDIIIYRDSVAELPVHIDTETVWLTQAQIADLFQTERSVVTKHLQNIFKTDELEENRTCAFFAQVRIEGGRQVTREVVHYNLDAILSVGYRVNSKRGTQFRIWATARLKEALTQRLTTRQPIHHSAIKFQLPPCPKEPLRETFRKITAIQEQMAKYPTETRAARMAALEHRGFKEFSQLQITEESKEKKEITMTQSKTLPEFMTVAEAAKHLTLSDQTVRRMIQAGDIKAFKIGGGIRIDRDAIKKYITKQKRAAGISGSV